MSFTGRTNDMILPEQVEDLYDLVGIISPYETPLLNAIGDAPFAVSKTNDNTENFTVEVEARKLNLSLQLSLADELDYQKQERLRESLRDLENRVVNGSRGVIPRLWGNTIDARKEKIDEGKLNYAIESSGNVDLIVVGGYQKRQINGFLSVNRNYGASDTSYRDMVSLYESDFGVYQVVVSRWVPADMVLLLDSSKIKIIPIAGRSFHYKQLTCTDNEQTGEIIGEYVLELKDENAHNIIRDLSIK